LTSWASGDVKIRQRPEDFTVTELDRCEPGPSGPFCLYRLTKWDIGTIEAIRNVARKWDLGRSRISFGGLKDRHARCTQAVSIRDGPERDFQGSAFRLEFLGRSRDPVTRASFDANRFEIVVRDLGTIPDAEPVRRFGMPNYFDDQRFGSLRGTGGRFIGRALVRGDFEEALRLALASPSPGDRRKQRETKTLLAHRWGDWARLSHELPDGALRGLAAYLAKHPGAFGTAFERLDADLRVLYVSAYQSWIWNRTLAEMLRGTPGAFEVGYAAGKHVFTETLEERFRDLRIPLVTASQKFEGEAAAAVERILAEEGVERRQFRLKRLRRTFFGKGLRDAIVFPANLSAAAADDELHRGRRKLTLSFELPKGSYATVLLKRLFRVTP
jgi:tRNA pseudouridine13 synthase